MKNNLLICMTLSLLGILGACQSSHDVTPSSVSQHELKKAIVSSSEFRELTKIQNAINARVLTSIENVSPNIRQRYVAVRQNYESQFALMTTSKAEDKALLIAVLDEIMLPAAKLRQQRDKQVLLLSETISKQFGVSREDVVKAMFTTTTVPNARPNSCESDAQAAGNQAAGYALSMGYSAAFASYLQDYVYNSALANCYNASVTAMC